MTVAQTKAMAVEVVRNGQIVRCILKVESTRAAVSLDVRWENQGGFWAFCPQQLDD
jgi:hypothetical protein